MDRRLSRLCRRDVRRTVSCIAMLAMATLGAWAPLVRADEPSVRAEVDRNHIGLDDRITLEVVIEGRVRSVEEPIFPPLDDFDVYGNTRSQSMQIVNGVMTVSTAFIYVLNPKREGTLTIGSFTVRAGGKEYKTTPITITVGGAASPRGAPGAGPGPGAAPEPAPEQREDRDVFVLGRVDKQNAYVNEQILYTFYLYRAERSAQITNLNYGPPTFQGFWVEKLKDSEKQSYKVINGRRFIVTEVTAAIFPTTSGKLTIEPATLQLVMLTTPFGFSFFDRGVEKVLRTKAIDVEVSALPVAGRPAIFEGAVGEALQLTARVDRTEVQEGDPVTVTVKVEGTGNVKTFSRPKLAPLPQFKTYDAESKTDVQTFDRVAGSRTWETVLVPKDEGEHVVPPIRLAYFDTREGQYRTLETKPMNITVVRGAGAGAIASSGADAPAAQQDIQILGRDIAHIRTDVPVSDVWTPLYRRGWFAVLAPLPFLAVIGVTLRRRRTDRLASDVALARASRARKLAAKRLAAARRALDAKQGEAFYAEVSRALRQYAGDKLNVAATGMTHLELRDAVIAAGAGDEAAGRLFELLERCDAARFAPGSMGDERLRDTLRDTESVILALDAQWGRRGGSGRGAAAAAGTTVALVSVLAVALLAVSSPVAAQPTNPTANPPAGGAAEAPDVASPSELLQRGHTAYEAGSYAEAIAAYRAAERAGVRNGGLYYDLGNAHYKNGELAQAIACYRRAEMLSPRDPQIQSNLAFARARREDKAVQPGDMPLVVWVRAVFRGLSLNEWVAATAALYALACGLWIVRALRRDRSSVVRIALATTVVACLLALVFTLAKVHAVRGVRHGVVTESRVAVMSGPGSDYTAEFSLHEGAEVRIESQRNDWVRITVTDALRGWVPARSVVGI
jgi:tetratricopeptide (TPR) repeat protein